MIRWFREAGFSDLYVADEPICVRGLKVLSSVSVVGLRVSASAPGPSGHTVAYAGLILFTVLLYVRPNDLLPIGTFPIVKIMTIGTLVAFFVERLTRAARCPSCPGRSSTSWPWPAS